jgi:hypothetical protein
LHGLILYTSIYVWRDQPDKRTRVKTRAGKEKAKKLSLSQTMIFIVLGFGCFNLSPFHTETRFACSVHSQCPLLQDSDVPLIRVFEALVSFSDFFVVLFHYFSLSVILHTQILQLNSCFREENKVFFVFPL